MEDILGYLKFSDNNLSDGYGETHFEQLRNGKIFFSSPHWFKDHGTEAQRDIEGSTKFLNYVQENSKSRLTLDDFRYVTKYVIPPIITLRYKKDKLRIKSYQGYNTDVKYYVSEEYLKKIELLKKEEDVDVLIYPKFYSIDNNPICTYEPNARGKLTFSFQYSYKFNGVRIELIDKKDETWKISSFVKVKKNDVDENGKLSREFINSLYDLKQYKGSIAIDNEGLDRPWIYVKRNYLVNILKLTFPEIRLYDISYYDNEYPFSVNELLTDPNLLLSAKRSAYMQQREARLIMGGPNKNFKVNLPNLVNLDWNTDFVTYGENKLDLENSTLLS